MTLSQFTRFIEDMFPPIYQEEWDNSGWNVNLHPEEALPLFICVDATESVIRAAAARGCRVVLSHHPLFFRPSKNLDTRERAGRLTRLLVEHGISVYCAHTSADNSPSGINMALGRLFDLQELRVLSPGRVPLYKIAVTVPLEDAEKVRDALFAAGAGRLGRYRDCAFTLRGDGTFLGENASNPYIGSPGERVAVPEDRVEVICSADQLKDALRAAREAHPYETPALDVYPLKQTNPDVGSGAVGTLPKTMTLGEFAGAVKEKLDLSVLRMRGNPDAEVRAVALCGGAGGDFIPDAESQGADVFLTGELKHNMFCDFRIPLLEVGHYASEKIFESIAFEGLQKRAPMLELDKDIFLSGGLECPYTDF